MANQASNRVRRFSLPDMADQRVEEAIDNFLTGPARRRSRPEDEAPPPSALPFGGLETRVAWTDALRRESARNLRYRRPAAVAVIAARPRPDAASNGWVGRVAGPIAHTIRRGVRETDLVTRAAEARFQILLPETTGSEANRLAARLTADCRVWLEAIGAPIEVRHAAVAATPHTTLEGALEKALQQLDAA